MERLRRVRGYVWVVLGLAAPFCGARVGAQQAAPIPYDHNAATGRFYDIRGFKMYTEVYGSGPPLLMIHGNNGDMSAFAENVGYFAKHYTVILADSRSQGRSLDPDHGLTFEMMADDYAALLDAMHLGPADVIGWSDGGINALLLAIRHPEKVKRLASTGANLWPTADAFQRGLWDGEKKEYEAGLHRTYATAKEKNDRKLFLLDWREPHMTLAQLHTIEAPSLIICGDHDLISVAHTVLIFENIPHAELWVVPNSGHGTLREHAEDFDRQVDRFFSEPYKDHK
ncbi:MAG TPA: alpha/beta hydrolase [Terracidiphilus sp.]|jgi:pimeloyl-ACP methyl ester carboxylesterase|nr:alpha/beta hydrolase [Terracidiphilus sp.]